VNFKDLFNKITSSVTTTIPDKKRLSGQIRQQQLTRSRQDIQDYRNALQAAESLVSPNRQQLYRLYKNIEMDAHLSSVVQSRKIKALSKSFRLVDADGNELVMETKLFKSKWFQDFLDLAFDSILNGFSLIEFSSINDNVPTGIKLVPRENVKPAPGIVVESPGFNTGVSYVDNPWLVPVGKSEDLGLYAKAAPLILLKQHTLAAQAQFIELFGMPVRIGKTDMADEEHARSMFKMLQEMNSAAFTVVDLTDEVTFAESIKGNGDIYEKFLTYVDAQISKLVFGQTMMSDNGSSRSQSEVHERLSNAYCDFDLKLLSYCVNDTLIPNLVALGLSFLQGASFEFFDNENTNEQFDRTIKLLQAGYQIDSEWISEKFNIPVSSLPAQAANFPLPL
jgi:phage gp29-like protein